MMTDRAEKNLALHEKTLSLLQKAQAGDETAREALVYEHTALVKSVVKRFLHRGYEYDDLFQLGCMGLVKAINGYQTAYNVRFPPMPCR
ncbi:MAG: sigma factor [Christensenellales bacterium]